MSDVEELLREMPKSLREKAERVLSNIDKNNKDHVREFIVSLYWNWT